jgi:hypothetical protein
VAGQVGHQEDVAQMPCFPLFQGSVFQVGPALQWKESSQEWEDALLPSCHIKGLFYARLCSRL